MKEQVQKSAVLSDDGMYRYRLDRWWGPGNRLVFLMMNPSTADAEVDDATIRKCMGFARRWNYDGITVVNLFALRSRDPKELLTASDPVGPENLTHLAWTLAGKSEVICAWGCENTLSKMSASHVTLATRASNTIQRLVHIFPSLRMMCLGLTKGFTPRHPLMLAYSTMAVEYK